PETCKYEPEILTVKKLVRNLLRFFAFSLIAATGLSVWYINRYAPLEEQNLQVKNYELKDQWKTLNKEIDVAYHELKALINQDDNNYRVILDLQPLGSEVREAGVGGAEPSYLAEVKNYNLISETYKRFEKLKHQLDVEKQSFDELAATIETKRSMWASRPAIQPIDNKDLQRLHTTFGLRFHPLLGYTRPHKGLDFTAPIGTPVYATGDGKVATSYYSNTFGNVVYIDHGFNFETRYAHLTKYIVETGERIKRGQIIGYVGNTGTSVSAHLHYEILFNNEQINPINFFQRDLSNQEYEKLINLASTDHSALD
ncbi:MAG TPA: M23 family metallopeptidase, partial [Cyclobacteriaceae bacterium]|nr:M23 family metallopeptidase [Cyclobacteriaceae bacterium]